MANKKEKFLTTFGSTTIKGFKNLYYHRLTITHRNLKIWENSPTKLYFGGSTHSR